MLEIAVSQLSPSTQREQQFRRISSSFVNIAPKRQLRLRTNLRYTQFVITTICGDNASEISMSRLRRRQVGAPVVETVYSESKIHMQGTSDESGIR